MADSAIAHAEVKMVAERRQQALRGAIAWCTPDDDDPELIEALLRAQNSCSVALSLVQDRMRD